MQPHLVHQLIHDEGSTRHITTVFHVRDEEIEDENLWKEDDNGSHTTNDSVDKHVFHRTIGHV